MRVRENIEQLLPVWMRRNPVWMEFWDSYAAVFEKVLFDNPVSDFDSAGTPYREQKPALDILFTPKAGSYGVLDLYNLYDMQLIPSDYLQRIADLFAWNLDYKNTTPEGVKAELLGLTSWFKERWLIGTYRSFLTSLGFSGRIQNLSTVDFVKFFVDENDPQGVYTDVGLVMDTGYAMDNIIHTPHILVTIDLISYDDETGTMVRKEKTDRLKSYIENVRYVNSRYYFQTYLKVIHEGFDPIVDALRGITSSVSPDFVSIFENMMDLVPSLEMDTGVITDFDDAAVLLRFGTLRVGFDTNYPLDYSDTTGKDFTDYTDYIRKYETGYFKLTGAAKSLTEKYIQYFILYDNIGVELFRVTCPGIFVEPNLDCLYELWLSNE